MNNQAERKRKYLIIPSESMKGERKMNLQQNLSNIEAETLKQIEEAARDRDVRRIFNSTKTLEEIEKRKRLLMFFNRITRPQYESVDVCGI